MNDIGKELYERVRADFERRLAAEKHPPKDMRGVSDYSARVGRYLAEAIAANVTEDALPVGRLYYNIAESILAPALRTNYELVNDTAAEVQRLLDERQGLRIKPARADYPAERVHAVIGAASEEGIPFDKALRRMTSPAENITQSFADDFMQANAAQRSKAGFDTFIERQGGFNCCPWCAGLVGVFAYPKGLPKEVFARHDNCTCSVTYGTRGGARQNVWSKQTWSNEQEREYLRLTDEAKRGNGGKRLTPKQIAAIREKVQAPRRLTKEQAAALGAFAQPRRLTGGANGGIIGLASNAHSRNRELEETIKRCINQEKPVFADDLAKYFKNIPPEKGKYIMALHGSAKSGYIYGYEIDARTLANIVKSRKDYNGKDEIILISCNTGSEDLKKCFAQEFATAMGVRIHAPTHYGAISPWGSYYSSDKKGKRLGKFKPFDPKKGDDDT